MARKYRTPEERIAAMNSIADAMKSGKRMVDACRDHGITDGAYYRWRKMYAKKTTSKARVAPSKLVTFNIPEVDDSITLIMGKTKDVLAALGHVSTIQRR